MHSLATFARWEAVVLIAGCFAIVVWKYLTMKNPFHQLLDGDRADGTTYLSSGRIQLLAVTSLFAGWHLLHLFQSPTTLPEFSNGMLMALGGSQMLYLAGKAYAILFSRRNVDLKRRNS